MNTHIAPDLISLSREAADFIVKTIQEVLQEKDRFSLVLSGGSTPKALHELLASAEYRDRIDWSKIHIFWGDERVVPFTDSRNNARMAFDTLLDKVPVPKEQIHRMQTNGDPAEMAAAYEELLHDYFRDSHESFDLVLLGMGDDGHTLSLFPHQPVINESKAWVKSLYLEEQKMYRITLTAPIVNRSKNIVFLIAGANKAGVLKQVMEGAENFDLYPSQIIRQTGGELVFFIDREAASDIL